MEVGNQVVEKENLMLHMMTKTFFIISSIGRKFWGGKDCKLVDDVGVVIVKGHINACNPKEVVVGEDLGETNVGMTILSYPCNIIKVMSIWRWLMSQTIFNGHSFIRYWVFTMGKMCQMTTTKV
jgi:hypothetical protein